MLVTEDYQQIPGAPVGPVGFEGPPNRQTEALS